MWDVVYSNISFNTIKLTKLSSMTKMKFASARNLPANKQNWSVNFIMNIFQIVTAVTKISKSLKFRPSIISDYKTQKFWVRMPKNSNSFPLLSWSTCFQLWDLLRQGSANLKERCRSKVLPKNKRYSSYEGSSLIPSYIAFFPVFKIISQRTPIWSFNEF